ncbi:MAG: hypothetical protein O2794_04475 [bacterium]|nr:hypothetical protein [bacterium]
MASEDLMCLLKESHAKHFKADNNFMICQSEITNSHRKNDNVVAMNFMVLDVDFPEVLPVEEMQKALSGIRCLITNTKSSTKETPKYRVYMPFRSPCNVDDYRALEGIIKTRIKLHCQENGITRPKNSPAHNAKSFYGIDKASFVLSQAFWLPSRADFSFICELEGDFIDVIEWLYEKRKVSEPRYDPEFVYSMPKNLPTPANDIEDKVEAIKSHYLCLTDNHNNEFYKATLKLCRLGLSEGEILNVLYELGRSHKPSKYAQSGHINAAIKNARRYLQVA